MNEWTNEWMNEWMTQWINEWNNESINQRMNEWMNEWMNESISQSMNGSIDQSINQPAWSLCPALQDFYGYSTSLCLRWPYTVEPTNPFDMLNQSINIRLMASKVFPAHTAATLRPVYIHLTGMISLSRDVRTTSYTTSSAFIDPTLWNQLLPVTCSSLLTAWWVKCLFLFSQDSSLF